MCRFHAFETEIRRKGGGGRINIWFHKFSDYSFAYGTTFSKNTYKNPPVEGKKVAP